MDVASALLWIWPLPYELLTEQSEWKWESGTQKGLPQGHFYYFQAEEEKRRKSATDYLTHAHNVR